MKLLGLLKKLFSPDDKSFKEIKDSKAFKKIQKHRVPDDLHNVLQKIKQRELITQEEIQSFEVALDKIENDNVHDTPIYFLYTLENHVYADYKQELRQNRKLIERHLLAGKPLPQPVNDNDSHYHGLFNLQQTKIFYVYRNRKNNGAVAKFNAQLKIFLIFFSIIKIRQPVRIIG